MTGKKPEKTKHVLIKHMNPEVKATKETSQDRSIKPTINNDVDEDVKVANNNNEVSEATEDEATLSSERPCLKDAFAAPEGLPTETTSQPWDPGAELG